MTHAKKHRNVTDERGIHGGRSRSYNDPEERYDRYSSRQIRDLKEDQSGWGEMARQDQADLDRLEHRNKPTGIQDRQKPTAPTKTNQQRKHG